MAAHLRRRKIHGTSPGRIHGKSANRYTDYETIGLSLEFHPMALLRPQLNKLKAITAVQLQTTKNGRR